MDLLLICVIGLVVLALVFAVPIGVLMGSSPTARGLIEPVVELLRPIPPIAMIPLAILWFGTGTPAAVRAATVASRRARCAAVYSATRRVRSVEAYAAITP